MTEKKLLTEVFIPTYDVPGYIGFYHNSDGSKRWITSQSEIDKINSDDNYFLSLFKRKGDAANFAYKYKVGYKIDYDPSSYMNNFDWICADSWYCSNYFYIKNVPGFIGKTVAFTLRVADHPVRAITWFSAKQWEKKHNAKQFVLNILIDPKVNNRAFNDDYNDEFPLTVINAVYNPYRQNKEVEELMSNIVSGKQPVYEYKDILRMFGSNVEIDKFGNGNLYNTINFQKRFNPQPKRQKDTKKQLQKPLLNKIKKVWFDDTTFGDEDSITVNINGFDYTIYKPTIEEIKGKEYYQIRIDDDYYVMDDDTGEVRKRRKDGNVVAPDRLTAPMTTEHIIKLTDDDIKNMVLEVINKLKKRLV